MDPLLFVDRSELAAAAAAAAADDAAARMAWFRRFSCWFGERGTGGGRSVGAGGNGRITSSSGLYCLTSSMIMANQDKRNVQFQKLAKHSNR